jgi:tight adherence protein C
VIELDLRLILAALSAIAVVLIGLAGRRQLRRRRIRARLRSIGAEAPRATSEPRPRFELRALAGLLGRRVALHLPSELGTMSARADRAGLAGRISGPELLGWKIVGAAIGLGLGVLALIEYGTPGALLMLVTAGVGWFGVDLGLARYHAQRRRAILRDLPTVMDLLVLSMEAGMGLDRALRTIVHEYRSPLADEIQRVLTDTDLGTRRGEAFQRMARRVGLDDLLALSRAIMQSEELGISLVGVMQSQSREVRVSRRHKAEAEALKAPIKMLFPLVLFILPTLFMLLLGPVALRAGTALSGAVP